VCSFPLVFLLSLPQSNTLVFIFERVPCCRNKNSFFTPKRRSEICVVRVKRVKVQVRAYQKKDVLIPVGQSHLGLFRCQIICAFVRRYSIYTPNIPAPHSSIIALSTTRTSKAELLDDKLCAANPAHRSRRFHGSKKSNGRLHRGAPHGFGFVVAAARHWSHIFPSLLHRIFPFLCISAATQFTATLMTLPTR